MTINIVLYFFIFLIFSISIFGYGLVFHKFLINDKELKLGETGIFGFIFLYLISVTFHFFIPINIFFSNLIILIGLFIFIKFFSQIKLVILKNLHFYLIIFILSLILSATNNLHDDVYLYQLPYINYLQSEKIVFGLVSLNDFAAYSHGLYDVMSLFKVQVMGNQTIFILPVIFVMFFVIFLMEYLQSKKNYLNVLIYIIFILILFKFARSKQYGTDIPVICLIFMIQIYVMDYLKNNQKVNFFKTLIIFIFAIFLKIYAVFALFYLLIFLKSVKKNFLLLINNRKVIFFIFFISLITFTKNIIHTGCALYPITNTCFEKDTLNWSLGKKATEIRKVSLESAVKGIRAYIRDNNHQEIITPQDYLKKFKYNYLTNVLKDPDFERFLIVLLIFLILILVNALNFIFNQKKKINEEKFEFKYLLLSIMPFVAWLLYIPHLRYGGYAYIILFLYITSLNLNLLKYLNQKNLNMLLILGLLFFATKNIVRIQKEYTSKKFSIESYPFPKFKEFKFKKKKIEKIFINISNHWQLCGEIRFPCTVSSISNSITNIKKKNGYYFIFSNEIEVIKHMNKEIYKIHYEMNY